MAMKRLRKINDTMTIKLRKYMMASVLLPQPIILRGSPSATNMSLYEGESTHSKTTDFYRAQSYMIDCHASPVAILNSVIKAFGNV